MIGAAVLGTGSALPRRAVDTRSLIARALPHRDADDLARRVGIDARYWVGEGESAASLAAAALGRALATAGIEARALRRIVFVSSTGGDSLIPATANAVAEALGLDDTCDAFDVNNSCAGFITGFDLAARSAATGLGPVGVVAAEVFSRYVAPEKPRPYLVLGDAAAAAVIGAPRASGEGVLGSFLSNNGRLRGRMTTAHPGVVRGGVAIDFLPSSEELTASAFDAMQRSAAEVLGQAGLGFGDVEWVLPHQPNGEMLARIVEKMGVDPARLVPVVREIGSVGAASVPFSLDRLLGSGRVRAGDRVLMLGVGSGTGYGAVLYRHAGARSTEGAS